MLDHAELHQFFRLAETRRGRSGGTRLNARAVEMRTLHLAPLLLLVALSTGCSFGATRTVVVTATPGTHIIRVLNPAALVLTLNDVPPDSIEMAARFHSNRQVAATYGMSLAALERRGRLTSYETSFQRKGANGLLRIDDVVAAWKTAAGAHWDYSLVVRRATHPTNPVSNVHSIGAYDLGDERHAVSFHVRHQPSNLIDYAVIFRRGRYRVYLQAVGLAGTVANSDVLKYAHLLDRRILNRAY